MRPFSSVGRGRRASNPGSEIHLSEVISALSYALDLVEGQPVGHAARSCVIGMRLAREIGLPEGRRAALFYALLLKDLGCSSNASKVCYLFGADDREAKGKLKTTDWTSWASSVRYVARAVAPGQSLLRRVSRFCAVAAGGQRVAKELVQIRCDRGADIARGLGMPDATAEAIRSLDEHYDGRGHPDGVVGEAIPLLARVLNLAQTAEVFWRVGGADAACDVVRARRGTWFDPELARAFESLRGDAAFWAQVGTDDAAAAAAALDPAIAMRDGARLADGAALDRVAEGFARVIDAKSPWTFCHSAGVAEVAAGIGATLGLGEARLAGLRRAALLHDIGKLGVSNLILDKPGRLDERELAVMRRHPRYTKEILDRVRGFAEFAEVAASHHERLDGRGYYRGLGAGQLSLEARVLAVADTYEALAAKRPYRRDLTREDVMAILDKEAGAGLCPAAIEGLKAFLARSHFVPYQVAA